MKAFKKGDKIKIAQAKVSNGKQINYKKINYKEVEVLKPFNSVNLVLVQNSSIERYGVMYKGKSVYSILSSGDIYKAPPTLSAKYHHSTKEEAEKQLADYQKAFPDAELKIERGKDMFSLTHPQTGFAVAQGPAKSRLEGVVKKIKELGIVFPATKKAEDVIASLEEHEGFPEMIKALQFASKK
jgi:ABC-type Fe3+-hydroxamate transport system substrate-binding protein